MRSKLNKKITMIISIFIILLLAGYAYFVIDHNKHDQSILSDYLPTINKAGLSSYLIDNPDVIIYYAPTNTSENKQFEIELKNHLEKIELKEEIVMLDANTFLENDYSELETLLNELMIDFSQLKNQTNIFVINNRFIDNVLYEASTKINFNEVKDFLENYEVNYQ